MTAKTWKAVKTTNGNGKPRWHINDPETTSEKSICGHIDLDKGRSRPGTQQDRIEIEFQEISELEEKLGKVCGRCSQVFNTRQPGYTPPSIRVGEGDT